MRERPLVRRRCTALAVGVLLVSGLAACGSAVDTPEERVAQQKVVELLRQTAMATHSQDIDDFARAAAGIPGSPMVVRIDEARWFEPTEVLGSLTFGVSAGDPPEYGGFIAADSDWDPGPYCFRVAFDHYGKDGEFGTADGVRLVECPEGAGPVELPPAEVVAVAGNAREAAHAVLDALPDSGLPSEDEIAARVAALLDPPDADHITTAPPSVAVLGSDVGIAMGGPDDCVLVARVLGVVKDVHAPWVYLQPGELGCTSGTALVADLSPPH